MEHWGLCQTGGIKSSGAWNKRCVKGWRGWREEERNEIEKVADRYVIAPTKPPKVGGIEVYTCDMPLLHTACIENDF